MRSKKPNTHQHRDTGGQLEEAQVDNTGDTHWRSKTDKLTKPRGSTETVYTHKG